MALYFFSLFFPNVWQKQERVVPLNTKIPSRKKTNFVIVNGNIRATCLFLFSCYQNGKTCQRPALCTSRLPYGLAEKKKKKKRKMLTITKPMPFNFRQRYVSCDSHHMISIGCWRARDLFGSESLSLRAAAPTRHLTHPALFLFHPGALICVQLAHAHLDARVACHMPPSGVQLLLQGDVRLFVLCAFRLGHGCREVRFLQLTSTVLCLCRLQHHG